MTEILVVGYSKAPAASASFNQTFTLVALVETVSHTVVECESTAKTALTTRWLRDILVGTQLDDDPAVVCARIESSYISPASRALQQAVYDLTARYRREFGLPQATGITHTKTSASVAPSNEQPVEQTAPQDNTN